MIEYLLSNRCSRSQAAIVMRWIAMDIMKAPVRERARLYWDAGRTLEAAIKRFGVKDSEIDACVARNMDALRDLVEELEARHGVLIGAPLPSEAH